MDCFAKCKLNFHSMILGYIVPSKVHVFPKKRCASGRGSDAWTSYQNHLPRAQCSSYGVLPICMGLNES